MVSSNIETYVDNGFNVYEEVLLLNDSHFEHTFKFIKTLNSGFNDETTISYNSKTQFINVLFNGVGALILNTKDNVLSFLKYNSLPKVIENNDIKNELNEWSKGL